MAREIYIASVTRNRRAINSTEPKSLLIDIYDINGNLFRDHCWINEELVKELIPKSPKGHREIKFRATTHNYMSCDENGNLINKQGLQNIKIIYPKG